MRRFRAVQTIYSNGDVNVQIQKRILWWWVNMSIEKCTFFNRRSNIINKEQSTCISEYASDINFELKDTNDVEDILTWLSSNKKHHCFIDKDDKKIVYGIEKLDPDCAFTYYASKNLQEILVFEEEYKLLHPVHKTHIINWNVIEDCNGYPRINKKTIWSDKKY